MQYQLFSWNVNGLRAVLKKGALQDFLAQKNPDIICLQEIKAKQGQAELDFPAYQELWNPAERPGYSGTAIFTKPAPLGETLNVFSRTFATNEEQVRTSPVTTGASKHQAEKKSFSASLSTDAYGDSLSEGRVLAAEYPEFYLVNVYTPNSKPDLSRLTLRENFWDPAFLNFLKDLEQHKPVVVCGDFNAAHTEIDLARPKDNEQNAGYTPAERQGISNLISAGFIDTFRALHPAEQKYTWWSFRAGARARNIGWRIDYFFISEQLRKNLRSAEIYNDIAGSDHCPISITLEFPS